jgi:hypothetical protein
MFQEHGQARAGGSVGSKQRHPITNAEWRTSWWPRTKCHSSAPTGVWGSARDMTWTWSAYLKHVYRIQKFFCFTLNTFVFFYFNLPLFFFSPLTCHNHLLEQTADSRDNLQRPSQSNQSARHLGTRAKVFSCAFSVARSERGERGFFFFSFLAIWEKTRKPNIVYFIERIRGFGFFSFVSSRVGWSFPTRSFVSVHAEKLNGREKRIQKYREGGLSDA